MAKRAYSLGVRKKKQEETRQKIVEATVALHQEVGPRKASISAIAERAGVERLTVYRHFPDEQEIFNACSARFLEVNPPPDPAAWMDLADPEERSRKALGALFGYFSKTQEMFTMVYRDVDDILALRNVVDGFEEYLRQAKESLLERWAPRVKGQGRKETLDVLQSVLRHAVQFSTWKSLEDAGLSNGKKVAALVVWARAVCDG